jgi:hypothetical protein
MNTKYITSKTIGNTQIRGLEGGLEFLSMKQKTNPPGTLYPRGAGNCRNFSAFFGSQT